MVIDFHSHVFPDKIAKSTISALEQKSNGKASTDGTVEGLIKAMDRANADICVTLPVLTKPSQFESVANFAIELNKLFANSSARRIISFAGMHPKCENVSEKMKYLKENGIKGVKIHPDYQETYIDDAGYIEILKCAKELDLIVVTHSGVDDGYIGQPVKCTPDRLLKVIDEVDHGKFVLGHFGAHKMWEEVLEKLAGKNVYFDTAFTLHEIDEELFKKIVSKHGEDKVLFATDCPWRDIVDDLAIINSFNIKTDILEKILYKNAINLLGI